MTKGVIAKKKTVRTSAVRTKIGGTIMSKKFLSLVMALVMMFAVMAPAFAQVIETPDNFLELSKEERRAWLEQNVQPGGELKYGIQDRAAGWHYANESTTYVEAGLTLGTLSTTAKWLTNASNNVTDYDHVSLTFTPGPSTQYTSSNDDMYAYLPHSTMCRMTFETRFVEIVSVSEYYYAHVYFLNGDGTYTMSEIK